MAFTKQASGIGTYLNSIGRIPLLTAEQEILLARQIGEMRRLTELDRPLTNKEKRIVRMGERARQKFVKANLRLVVVAAKKYAGMVQSMDLMDLVQEGNMGLAHAAEKFDPERGYKFSTYAYWWIRQSMTRAMRYKDRMIRLPGNISDMAYTWNGKFRTLQLELGRTPTKEELAQSFKVSSDDVDLFLERGATMTSLDIKIGDDKDSSLLDCVTGDGDDADSIMERAVLSERYDMLKNALDSLDHKERDMVVRRFALGQPDAEPCTLKELSEEYGVSKERARQIITRGMNRIRIMMSPQTRVAA